VVTTTKRRRSHAKAPRRKANQTAPDSKTKAPAADKNRFEHDLWGLIDGAEKWLRRHRVPQRDFGLWTMLLPDEEWHVSISLKAWTAKVDRWLEAWRKAGWQRAPAGREYQVFKTVGDVPMGIQFADLGSGVYAVRKGDPEFFSDTGYMSLSQIGSRTTPAAAEKLLLKELEKFRQKRAKVELKRLGGKRHPPRASAPLRETPSVKPGAPGGNGEAAGTAMVLRQDGPDLPAIVSLEEAETLKECEETIRQNLHGFIEVGQALGRIQQERLYRGKYKTFEEYCRTEWDFARAYAYRLVSAASVVKRLEVSPIGDGGKSGTKRSDLPDGHIVLPATESQVRPLTRLTDPKQQIAAWKKVLKAAPRGADNVPRVTAEIVERVVAETIGEPTKRPAANGHAAMEEPRAKPQSREGKEIHHGDTERTERDHGLPLWKLEAATLLALDRELEETVKTYSLDELDELLLLLRDLAGRVVALHAKWRQGGARRQSPIPNPSVR
jgi:hypothetical protein